MSLAKAMEFEEMPMNVSKSSARKIVKNTKQKSIEQMAVGDFLWGKVKQHRWGLIATLFVAENLYFAVHFVMYGVN